MRTFTLHTEQQGTREFAGVLLGTATSEVDQHNHPDTDYVAPGRDEYGRKNKCGACRWLESTVYRTDGGKFVLHTVGRTIVPGEIDYGRIVDTSSAYELLELATVRAGKPYLPAPTARALAQAADKDDDVRDAYVDRAVI